METGEKKVLQELKTLVEGSSKLQKYQTLLVDEFLLHFARGKKFDSAKAFSTLENYISVREKHANILGEIRSDNIPVLDKGILRVLKRRDELGRAVFYWDFRKWDQSTPIVPDDFTRVKILLLEELWKEKAVETHGIVNIIDHAFVEMRHLAVWTPPAISRIVKLAVNNFPIRYADVSIINAGVLTHWIMKIAIVLLPTKLRSRIQILRKEEVEGVREKLKFLESELPLTIRKDWNEESVEEGSEEGVFDLELEERVRRKDSYYANLTQLINSPSLFQ